MPRFKLAVGGANDEASLEVAEGAVSAARV